MEWTLWVILGLAVLVALGFLIDFVSPRSGPTAEEKDTAAFYDEVDAIVAKARKNAGLE